MQTKRCVKKIRQTESACKPQDRRTVQKFEGAQPFPVVIEVHLKEKCNFYIYQKLDGWQMAPWPSPGTPSSAGPEPYGNMDCQVFKEGIQNLIDFLSKIQDTLRKMLYLVNRHSVESSKIGHHSKKVY